MKQNFILFFALFLFGQMHSQSFVQNGVNYAVTSSTIPRTVEVVASTNIMGNIFLPSTLLFINSSYSVTTIRTSAFATNAFSSLSIPASVVSVGNTLFLGCSGLSTIICNSAVPPAVDDYTFTGFINIANCTLFVPVGSLSAYSNAAGWSTFRTILACIPVVTFTETSGVAANDGIICAGDAVTLTSTGATSYQWIPGGATTRSITVSPTTTTDYTITTNGGICGSKSATATITVIPANTIVLSSGAGTNSQLTCVNSAINTIAYTTTGATGATFTNLPNGVSGSWNANVVTILGTPTVLGTSTYTVNLTGGCGTVTTTGTITVNPTNTITLSSAVGTNDQTACLTVPITNITYATTGATGATFSGLANGLSGSWSNNVITISGVAQIPGINNYTVTLTGGCGPVTAIGRIFVKPYIGIGMTSASGPTSQTLCINAPLTTISYVGINSTGATFSGLPAGVTGSYNINNNIATISGVPTAAGSYLYTVIFSDDVCTRNVTGTITVNPTNTITLSSAVGTNAQNVCLNAALTSITYATVGATGATFSGLPAGVAGTWNNNVVTLFGTPTVSGTFNYTITLTGGCGTITTTGIITVKTINTITLTSALGTTSQGVCGNQQITNITYATTGATGATFTDLPGGISGSWSNNIVTISGVINYPPGTYNYTVNLTGGCGTITATGTFIIDSVSGYFFTSPVSTHNQNLCSSTPIVNIVYRTTANATGVTVNGLPPGVTGTFNNNFITISGTPTVAGNYPFSFTILGNCPVTITNAGIIIVRPAPSISYSNVNANYTINSPITALTLTNIGGSPVSTISTVGSGFVQPFGIAVDANNNVFVGDDGSGDVTKITPAGVQTILDNLGTPTNNALGLSVDNAGNVYAAVKKLDKVYKITAVNTATEIFGTYSAPHCVAFHQPTGALFITALGTSNVKKITADGTVSTVGTGFVAPIGVAVDVAGNVYVADRGNSTIKKIDTNNVTSNVVNTGLNAPQGVALDANGTIFVANTGGNNIVRITGINTFDVVATGFNNPAGLGFDTFGNLYVADYSNGVVKKVTFQNFAISPPLPAGLTFNTVTGTISGTPSSASPTTAYTVTTQNSCGTNSTTLSFATCVGILPTFTQVAPICAEAPQAALPLRSINNFTGTWSPAINNTTTTTYTFTPTAGQCATTATMTVVVNPVLVVSAGNAPAVVCPGTNVLLNGTTSAAAIGFVGSFAPSNWTFTNVNANATLNTTAAPNSITINGNNYISSSSGDTKYSIIVPSAGTISFSWSYNTTSTASSDFPLFIKNGIVTLYDNYNPSGSNIQSGTMTIAVNNGDEIAFYTRRDRRTTSGTNSITISNFTFVSVTNLNWTTTNGTLVGATNGLSATASAPGTYTLTATGANGCTKSSDVVVNYIIDTTAPTAASNQTFCAGEPLANIAITGTGIIWYNAATAGTILPSTALIQSGTTYYASQTANGCESSTRTAITMASGACLGNENFDDATFNYYPNPTNGKVYFLYAQPIEKISVSNVLGQVMLEYKSSSNQAEIDLSGFAGGTYLVKVFSENQIKVIKILKK